ncbi:MULTISPECIES: glutamyl-tRNA reductase [Clostridium]|uniref:glutamyl-tRNA reductase n=1 Tax=Clostridium TaxID=1485 RepID=UPI00069EEE3C|nr:MULTISPECIES: glutamyl-tRNA reductase [Clostridium]KOF57053.1 glutamyl-tRNA reductase [Clostridium sp. DMHC 10]MCD2347025.1 glutamyl-tRNA reductase [Clostridium guangxiense]
MIQVLGLKKELKIEIREKFSIIPKHVEEKSIILNEVCDEVVVISTCNRTEIYFNSLKNENEIIDRIFEKLNWNKNFIDNFFYYKDNDAIWHLMDVICGFDSLILGEDQILGQVKDAYKIAIKNKTVKSNLKKLFQLAVTLGKEFRDKTKLNRIPVSSASIAVSEARKNECKRFMVMGFGNIGQLVCKYILSGKFDVLYVVARNTSAINIKDDRIKIIPFHNRKIYYKDVECMISCTAAPHPVIWERELPNQKFIIFDLAVPRDAEDKLYDNVNINIFDIDKISLMDSYNKEKRKEVMFENRELIGKYVKEFLEWEKVQKVLEDIINIKQKGENVYKKRYQTFKNKRQTKDNEKLACTLLKSTSDAYVNKAIEVLKEEQLNGNGAECLRIIRKIFYKVQ